MTAAWSVEDDVSWDELERPLDVRNPALSIDGLDEQFPADYLWLRDSGCTDDEIAERLGLPTSRMPHRLKRAGIPPRRETSADRTLAAVLERLVATGKPFSSGALPEGSGVHAIATALSALSVSGRIVKVGEHRSDSRGAVALWVRAGMGGGE